MTHSAIYISDRLALRGIEVGNQSIRSAITPARPCSRVDVMVLHRHVIFCGAHKAQARHV